MDKGAHFHKKVANMKCQRVKKDDSFVSALEDEAIEVEHLLAEPKNDNVSVDGVLSFGEENLGKCLQMEDFSCGFEYGLRTSSGNTLMTCQTPLCVCFFL
jgi:hypothetical protein